MKQIEIKTPMELFMFVDEYFESMTEEDKSQLLREVLGYLVVREDGWASSGLVLWNSLGLRHALHRKRLTVILMKLRSQGLLSK